MHASLWQIPATVHLRSTWIIFELVLFSFPLKDDKYLELRVLAKSISNGLRTKFFFEVAEVKPLQYVKRTVQIPPAVYYFQSSLHAWPSRK